MLDSSDGFVPSVYANDHLRRPSHAQLLLLLSLMMLIRIVKLVAFQWLG
jgi:hypothetical protein